MAVQLNYNYGTPKAIPGQKADISPIDVVVARLNTEDDGDIRFGMAVAPATGKENSAIALPTGATTEIAGVVLHGQNYEQDMSGAVIIKKNDTLGVIRKGHVWARLKDNETEPKYGTKAYVVINGDGVGCFTATEDVGNTLDIGATFGNASEIDAVTHKGIAIVELN